MIDFKTIKVGDKVKVVGAGAPGFAKMGDELEITRTQSDRVYAKRDDGDEAFFALTCGAARLELVTPNAGVTGQPPAQTVELPPKPAGGRSELT